MVTKADQSYIDTKLILQGKGKISEDLVALAEWIDATYRVKPINVIYDKIKNGDDRLPRLQVIFFLKEELDLFYDGPYNFDKAKQAAIANEFKKELALRAKESSFFIPLARLIEPNYDTDRLTIVFSAFEPVAKNEATDAVGTHEIDNILVELNNTAIWKVMNTFGTMIFFFYTDAEVKANSENGYKELLTDKCFQLVKQYDEFDLFKREGFSIEMDSKENFDTRYQGNWYYYFK